MLAQVAGIFVLLGGCSLFVLGTRRSLDILHDHALPRSELSLSLLAEATGIITVVVGAGLAFRG